MAKKETVVLRSTPTSSSSDVASFPKERFTGLDGKWIADLVHKRNSNYSTVLVVETEDPTRWYQVQNHFTHSEDARDASIYLFDMWGGLKRYDRRDETWGPVRRKASNAGYDEVGPTSNALIDLQQVLRYMDKQLKSEQTIFILQWLDVPDDTNRVPQLSYALRSWAFDSSIIAKQSTVILVAADTTKAIDKATVEVLAWSQAPLPQSKERRHIIEYSHRNLGMEPQETLSEVVRGTAGLNLHQLESVLLESWNRTGEFDLGVIKGLKAEVIKRSELVQVEEPDERGFDAVGGYGAVKEFIKQEIVNLLASGTRANRFGVSLPRGIRLFGPPGTGKTLLAKALAKETRLPFINLRTENLYSKWLGESGKRFSQAIRLCEQMSPALVFVDEIDRFGKRSGGGADGASQESGRVFSQVLEWLGDERRKSLVVGTTNEPDHLDEAFLREGRFDYKIPILYPSVDARREILRIHFGLTGAKPEIPWEASPSEIEELVDEIAEVTEGCTGAELEQICLRARRNGLNSQGEFVSFDDVHKAVESFRIDNEKRESVRQRYLQLAAKFTNDASFLKRIGSEK